MTRIAWAKVLSNLCVMPNAASRMETKWASTGKYLDSEDRFFSPLTASVLRKDEPLLSAL